MPTQEIRPHLSNVTLERLANLKKYWKASMAALLSKARTVKKITDSQYRYLWTQMGKAGYRLREPVDIPQEKSTLLSELISVHLREFGYGVDKLSDMLVLEKEDFAKLYATNGRHLRLAPDTQRKQRIG
jgi:Zn-dependent peptidase ImmA (M78 family)